MDHQDVNYLIEKLNDATRAYDEGCPYMSDKEYDDLYFKLQEFEQETGIVYPNSPTHKISFDVVSNLPKVKHTHPMLSLAKTKNVQDLESFVDARNDTPALGMLKLDGLTCSLTFENGELIKAETRGDGEVGEDVTHNAKVVSNIPSRIPYLGLLVVDGEIICKKNNFEEFSDQYKNPRNFASGSIRLLDSSECAKRNLSFVAWDVISDLEGINTLSCKLMFADYQGFEVTPWTLHRKGNLEEEIEWLRNCSGNYPIDGLVFKYDDCNVYRLLGYTDHHFRGGLAYKFYDETFTTHLRTIDYDVSRTGTLTPVAVFDPVEINGSTVSRASVHNITLLEQTLGTPYVGQELEVFKANEIIPQIYSAIKNSSNIVSKIPLPTVCPLCGGKLITKKDGVAVTLQCTNNNCKGKVLTRLEHFVSKQCMNIDGLARNTLESMYDVLGIKTFSEIYTITKNQLDRLPGFAETSVDNTYESIQNSKTVELTNFITAIGIPSIGSKQAEQISAVCTSWNDFLNKSFSGFDWTVIQGFGDKKSAAINSFNYVEAQEVAQYLNITNKQSKLSNTVIESSPVINKHVVITGSLTHFKNRNELVEILQEKGAIIQAGVTKQTDLLINNDLFSTSSKNKKAKELGVRIISEEQFMEEFSVAGTL